MQAGMIVVLIGVSAGCGEATTPIPAGGCEEGDLVGSAGSVCAGVPQAAVCATDPCTDGVSCATTITVASDAELTAALAGASAGTCVALASGAYGAATAPGGVSLLGRSAAEVTVEGVTLKKGEGAVLRGLTVHAGGVKVDGATGVQITSVLVSDSTDIGIEVTAGSSVKIVKSTVKGSSRHGLRASDGADISVDASIIEGSEAGIVAACSEECDACVDPPELSVTSSILRDNHIGGLVLFTSQAELKEVDILRTKQGRGINTGKGGGGLTIASCSSAVANELRIQDSAIYGVLIDHSGATLGSESAPDGDIDVSRNLVGVWVQDVAETQTVLLTRALLDENSGVGVGVSGQTRGFVLCRSSVQNTTLRVMPTTEGTSETIGDGLSWQANSAVTMESVAFSNNARASILIDGPAKGSISNVTLSDGDEQKGIQIQNVTMEDEKPTVGSGSPALRISIKELFSIPAAPAQPSIGL